MGQSKQLFTPSGEYCPAVQATAAAVGSAHELPAGQVVHSVGLLNAAGLNVPAGQRTGATAGEGQYEPAGQSTHAELLA